MSHSSQYQPPFVVIPRHVFDLPNITLAFLRVFETVYQFLHAGLDCFLFNDAIKERTGIASDSTIREALIFFEKHNILKREVEDGVRYISLCQKRIKIGSVDKNDPVDNSGCNSSDPSLNRRPPRRQSDAPPVDRATVEYNNINNNKYNNNIYAENDQNLTKSESKRITTQRRNKKRQTEIPDDLYISESHRKKANEIGVDVGTEFEKFKEWHGAKGSLFKDWSLAFHVWLGNAQNYKWKKVGTEGNPLVLDKKQKAPIEVNGKVSFGNVLKNLINGVN